MGEHVPCMSEALDSSISTTLKPNSGDLATERQHWLKSWRWWLYKARVSNEHRGPVRPPGVRGQLQLNKDRMETIKSQHSHPKLVPSPTNSSMNPLTFCSPLGTPLPSAHPPEIPSKSVPFPGSHCPPLNTSQRAVWGHSLGVWARESSTV